LTGIHS